MPMNADRKLTVEQAARLIYRSSSPSADQIERVAAAITRGDLAGGGGTTTAGDVADFLARVTLRNERGSGKVERTNEKKSNTSPRLGTEFYGKGDDLPNVYVDSLKNYILSAISRKHLKRQTVTFQRAVLAGQLTFLLGVVGLLAYSIRMISPPVPPEREAVVNWLEENTDYYRILQWHPSQPTADGQTVRMRVQYHYATSRGKGIDTDRLFLIEQGQVVGVESDW